MAKKFHVIFFFATPKFVYLYSESDLVVPCFFTFKASQTFRFAKDYIFQVLVILEVDFLIHFSHYAMAAERLMMLHV